MENTIINNVVLDKKMEGYHSNLDNFTAPQELTVTITLGEYRELVSKVATSDNRIEKAERDKYTRESENKKLTEEVAKLKAELYEMKIKYEQNKENGDE